MGASIFPEIEKKIIRHLRPTNDSWRVDETYIKVKPIHSLILFETKSLQDTTPRISCWP